MCVGYACDYMSSLWALWQAVSVSSGGCRQMADAAICRVAAATAVMAVHCFCVASMTNMQRMSLTEHVLDDVCRQFVRVCAA